MHAQDLLEGAPDKALRTAEVTVTDNDLVAEARKKMGSVGADTPLRSEMAVWLRAAIRVLDAAEADLKRLREDHAKCHWPTGDFID